MNLPGHYQPKLASFWKVGDKEVQENYLQGRENLEMVSIDAIYMGDGKEYKFLLVLSDKVNHNFY